MYQPTPHLCGYLFGAAGRIFINRRCTASAIRSISKRYRLLHDARKIAHSFKNEVTGMNDKSDVPRDRAFAIRCYAWSRAIHWLTVALVGGLLVTAPFEDINPHGPENRTFLWHSSLGLTVYLLSIARVLLWLAYRPTASSAGRPDKEMHRGLRVAFYALLVALPFSGWWLASEEGMPADVYVFGIPALPQWYYREGAAHSGSTGSEVSHEVAPQEPPIIRHLRRLHASLGAALAIVITLHLLSLIRARKKRRTDTQSHELRDSDTEGPI
jgi:cytochrome b561